MKLISSVLLMNFIICIMLLNAQGKTDEAIDAKLWEKALKITREAIVVDTHCDTPMKMLETGLDIGHRTDKSEVDLIRMKEGEVSAAFFAIFSPNDSDQKNPSRKVLEMIDEIYQQAEKYPNLAEMAFSPEDILSIHQKDKRAMLIGIENGGACEGSLRLLRDYYRLGVRYVTLTHRNNNDICDSSTEEKPRWNGLSNFGKEVVKEMNRLGMIIDVSHISDKSFYDVLELSTAPVMASHSCVRALCNVPRNMSDDMIKALAKKGGVIQINMFSGFLDYHFYQKAEAVRRKMKPESDVLKEKYKNDPVGYTTAVIDLWKSQAPPPPPIDTLINHIDYVVKLVGADYVGLGSDFDGAGSFPEGIKDISNFPLITYHLLKRGYSEENIKKILGGNFMRVFKQVKGSRL